MNEVLVLQNIIVTPYTKNILVRKCEGNKSLGR
jgi:hypothetical protein